MRDFKGIIDWSENKKLVDSLSKTGDCDIEGIEGATKALTFPSNGRGKIESSHAKDISTREHIRDLADKTSGASSK